MIYVIRKSVAHLPETHTVILKILYTADHCNLENVSGASKIAAHFKTVLEIN